MEDRGRGALLRRRQQLAGLAGWLGDNLDAAPLGLPVQLWHDRQLAACARADDEPGRRPRDRLVRRERGVTVSIAIRLGGSFLPPPDLATFHDDVVVEPSPVDLDLPEGDEPGVHVFRASMARS
jgi:hypothetical protein